MSRTRNRNQIKRLRLLRGLTSEQLAEKVGISQGYLSKIERGDAAKRGMRLEMLEKFAMALQTDVETVAASNEGMTKPAVPAGMQDDVVPYEGGKDDPTVVSPRRRQNIDEWEVRSNALSNLQVHPGMIAVVNTSDEAIDSIAPLAMVIAEAFDPATKELRKLLRQFVPPSLLITNSEGENAPIIDISVQDAQIRGVIEEWRRKVRTS
jgi:transcriptional regulator with XRE-family HTH domain